MRGDAILAWLLEPDPINPGVRFFALRDLLGRKADDRDLRRAQEQVMQTGPVPAILNAQHPEGYWLASVNLYAGKYRSSTWQVKFLAELGADPGEPRLQRACEYILERTIAVNGAFSASAPPVPSTGVHCLNGNLIEALIYFGFGEDERVQKAAEWQALAITGADPELKYYKSGTAAPDFACGVNLGQPCGWGAIKALRGLAAVAENSRSETVRAALETGARFLLSHDPAKADYPYTERVSSTWFKFGFPLTYWSDVLELAEVLVKLGYGKDARLENLLRFILSKADSQGRWLMENPLNGKMWIDIENKGKPSKWITLRAMRALTGAGSITLSS